MPIEIVRTACPHDCPSGCGLEVERLDGARIGRVRGDPRHPYTAGVICGKVARYAERVHHPDRLLHPLRRTGPKGSGRFEPTSWDEALDAVSAAFREAAAAHGPEAVWLYHSGGTMGLVQRYGQERLRNVMGYSGFNATICVTPAVSGWLAGVGALTGPDPREIAESDLVVIWGGNVVATQLHVMALAARARRERGAKLVVVDTYRTPTVEQADLALIVRPGTDGALACAVMHVLLAEGYADREFLARHTDFSPELERHLVTRTPAWAAEITGLRAEEIVAFARLYGGTPRSFIRLGFGFSRTRNGAASLHAVSCLPSVTNAWQHRGGGAFLICWGLAGLDNTLIQGLDAARPGVRVLDQSRIGAVLTGNADALRGGPGVHALLIQNGNPAVVSPDSGAVRRGLAREDLFLCVHEQFLTATARYADVVLPATSFLECDDLYQSYGQTHIAAGPRMLEPPGECRSNHALICALGQRLGADHFGFKLDERELLDVSLRRSNLPPLAEVMEAGWLDAAQDFATAHFQQGFPTPDGRFHFAPDWAALGPYADGLPRLPDHVALTDVATEDHPFRLVAPGSRAFLNTSFTEAPTSRRMAGRPTVLVHPQDAAGLAIADEDPVRIGNRRGSLHLHARRSETVPRGTLVVEGVWPNRDFEEGIGINLLVGADPVPPAGGVAFHDTAVWLRRA
jgi:anaerobic selenocysteine-containing dehydrogenase